MRSTPGPPAGGRGEFGDGAVQDIGGIVAVERVAALPVGIAEDGGEVEAKAIGAHGVGPVSE